MKRFNKNRMIAGIFAVLFVVNTAVGSISAFADEAVSVPSLSEVTAQTAESGFTDVLAADISSEGSIFTVDNDTVTDPIRTYNWFTMPDSIAAGQDVQVYGRVESTISALTAVTVAVYRADGTNAFVTGDARNPNSTAFEISNLDASVNFAALPAGNYYFVVMATNASYTNLALCAKKFTVVGASTSVDNIQITGNSPIPSTLTQGSIANVTGIVSSTISPLTRVVAAVYDSSNRACTGGQAKLNAMSYDVSRLAQHVQFNTLTPGNYTYRVTASNAANTDAVIYQQDFTVTAGGSYVPVYTTDSLTGNVTQIPSLLTQGTQVTISGTITSAASDLTYVSAYVYDSYGNQRTGYALAPHTKTYDLLSMSPYLNFASLSVGTYRYQVVASNGANSNVTLCNQTFTVQANNTYVTTDTMSVNNITQIPDNINVGAPVSIRGSVTSTYTNLTKVTAGVYNTAGTFVTGKEAIVNTKSYNLSLLDNYIYFNRLTSGTYEFRVTASNGSASDVVVYRKTFTVGSGAGVVPVDSSNDKISLTSIFSMPANIKRGQIVNVTGSVTSAASNLTSVGVYVYNSANQRVTGYAMNPKSRTFDLRNLDRYVYFNQLADGVYTLKVEASNGTRSNETLYQQQFTVGTGSGTAVVGDTISVPGYTPLPSTLQAGRGADVTGVVTSNSSNLTLVDVGIFNSAGQRLFGQTVYPNSRTYDLKLQDNNLRFDLLSIGQEYTFKVTASNASVSNSVLVSQKFTISSTATTPVANSDSITVSGITQIPDVITPGQAITINGKVTSAQSNIYSLCCGVFNSNGQIVTGRTVAPNSRTYDLHLLDADVQFNKLASGQTYTFAVLASNASNTYLTVYSKKFTVGANGSAVVPVTGDTMTLSGETQIPNSIAQNQAVSIKGYITSAYSNITNVSIAVYNANNQVVTGGTAYPNARTYDLKNLDSRVEFNKLPQGSYVYVVTATNGSGTLTLQNKSFTVGYGSTTTPTTTASGMSASGVTVVPSTINQGSAVSVKGTITSANSNITKLTCGVWDINTQKWMTGASNVQVNARSYDLSRIDAQVAFNRLPVGNYVFGVIASNGSKNDETLVSQKFSVVASGASTTPSVSVGDSITFSNTMRLNTSIKAGTAVSVSGQVTSASTNLTNVTVGIYNASGAGIYVSPVNPNSKTYNIRGVDAAMKFNLLSPGTYYFRVTASNGSSSGVTLVNTAFTVY